MECLSEAEVQWNENSVVFSEHELKQKWSPLFIHIYYGCIVLPNVRLPSFDMWSVDDDLNLLQYDWVSVLLRGYY